MSWWNIPDSTSDVTGDGPADAVDEALLGLADARHASQTEKPTLPELLRAVTEALSSRRELVEDLPAAFRIVTRDGIEAANTAPPDLKDAVGRALEGIAAAFRSDQQRPPRPAEVLYAFTFALGGDPKNYLSGSFPNYVVLKLR